MEQIPIKQPSKDWPWTLDVDGRPKQSGLDWEAVSRALSGLEKDPDSFVILQQTQGDEYWFMQCAVELDGPCMDKYLLECGWSSSDGPALVSLHCGLEEALSYFQTVFDGKPLDLKASEDKSSTLPANKRKKLLGITCLDVGQLGTNCYIVEEREQKLCAVIDPGGDADRILSYVNSHGLKVQYILLTHGHYDHVDGLPELAAALPEAEIWVHKKDVYDTRLPMLFPLKGMLEDPNCPVKEFHYLQAFNDRDVPTAEAKQLPLGELVIHPMHTPGHSEGSVSFRISSGPIFCGDTLFQGSCGRTDFPGGNVGKMMSSLRFFGLMNGDAEVYPGHMGATTLEKERKQNPYLRQALREAP